MINIATILKHNVIGKLLNHLIVFLINICLVRSMGAAGSGPYFNELYILNFLVFVFSAGLDYSAIAIINQEPKLLPVIHKMLSRVSVLFTMVMLLYVFVFFPYTNNYFKQAPIAILFFSIGNLLLIFYQGILSALKKFNTQNIILICSNVIFLGYLLAFHKNSTVEDFHDPEMVYAILFLAQGILMWVFSYSNDTEKTVSVSWNTLVRPGIYIMISSLVYFAFLRVDNFYVQKYTDGSTLGNYVQCGKIGQYFLYFSSVISSTLLPFIASESIGSSFESWKKMMKPYVLLLGIAVLFIAIFGKTIFPLIFGEDFTSMYHFMIILLPGFFCLGLLTLMNAIYLGKGNIKKILTGDLIGLLVVMGLDSWLVPEYGAYAAACISSAAYCLVFIYLLIGFKKQFALPAKTADIIQL